MLQLAGAAGLVALAACAGPATLSSPPASAPPSATSELPSAHVHGIGRDPGDGALYLATHDGLFRYTAGKPVRVGPRIDLMGFSIAGPGRFYASGHPGPGVDLPQPAGLIESRDAGRNWTVRSRGGESDFHALTASDRGVLGFDGGLRATADARTWQRLALPAQPRALASAPGGARVLATTANGVLSSPDQGRTWRPLDGAPLLLLADWADDRTVAGVTPAGQIAVSADAGRTWNLGAARVVTAQAMSAGRTETGRLEVVVVTDREVVVSLDAGATTEPLHVQRGRAPVTDPDAPTGPAAPTAGKG